MDFEERCWKAEAKLEKYKKVMEEIAKLDDSFTLADVRHCLETLNEGLKDNL